MESHFANLMLAKVTCYVVISKSPFSMADPNNHQLDHN